MQVEYNKLVRDLVPRIIEADGRRPVTRILGEEDYRAALHCYPACIVSNSRICMNHLRLHIEFQFHQFLAAPAPANRRVSSGRDILYRLSVHLYR